VSVFPVYSPPLADTVYRLMIFEFRNRLVIVVTNKTTVSFSRRTLLCGKFEGCEGMPDGQRNMLIELKLYQSTPFFSSVLD